MNDNCNQKVSEMCKALENNPVLNLNRICPPATSDSHDKPKKMFTFF